MYIPVPFTDPVRPDISGSTNSVSTAAAENLAPGFSAGFCGVTAGGFPAKAGPTGQRHHFGRGVRMSALSSSRMNTSNFAGFVALAFRDS